MPTEIMPGAVTVGFLHPGTVATGFCESTLALHLFDVGHKKRIVHTGHAAGRMGKLTGAGGLVAGRNELCQMFLDESGAEWLFMVDSDMAFEGDIVERLVQSADPVARPVVGGLCFAHKVSEPASLYGMRFRPVPTLYKWGEEAESVGFVPIWKYPRGKLVKVDGTGAACLLIHRDVLGGMRETFGDRWFDHVLHPKGPTMFSEDLSFCIRLAAAKVPLFVNTAAKTAHHKQGVTLDEEYYDDWWRAHPDDEAGAA